MIATFILFALMFIQTGVELAHHREPRPGYYNIWSKLIVNAIMLILYYYAGLFDKFM